ncbi:MAG: cysteine desulfurase [Methanomassiliicoccales archaeon]|nr:cysteine desulfurase [Methanomassiliicoccales archaeon]
MDRTAYLDNSATTPMDPRVLREMEPFFGSVYGNPSSIHSAGRRAAEAVEAARKKVAKAMNARPSEVIFTSGGTESDNIAIQGVASANRSHGDHIITSCIEHHAVLHICHHLEETGFKITYLPVDKEGLVSPDAVRKAMTPDTILVSIMAANSEIGTVQPIREIGAIAHSGGALFHTDAVQAMLKMPIDVDRDNIDLLSLSAHKMHGPKGVGALFVKKSTKISPITYGGGQEFGLRPSTENVAGIVGMGAAVEIGMLSMDQDIERMTVLRDRTIEGVISSVPGVHLSGSRDHRLCNNVHLRFDGLDGKDLVIMLDRKGIAVSTGTACSSRSVAPSHVVAALGVDAQGCRSSLRITLGRNNSQDEVDHLLEVLPQVVAELRSAEATLYG